MTCPLPFGVAFLVGSGPAPARNDSAGSRPREPRDGSSAPGSGSRSRTASGIPGPGLGTLGGCGTDAVRTGPRPATPARERRP
jgi:hypothetical protein